MCFWQTGMRNQVVPLSHCNMPGGFVLWKMGAVETHVMAWCWFGLTALMCGDKRQIKLN